MYIEFEKKCSITKEEFQKIINTFEIEQILNQKNYYFETDDAYFKDNASILRVRVENDTYQLTLKVQRDFANLEYNYFITQDEFESMKKNMTIPKILHKYLDAKIKLSTIKKILTNRHVIHFEEQKIEIDETNFGLITDYEVEIEAKNLKLAEKCMTKFCNKMEITYKKSMPKIHRYEQYNK